MKHNSIYNTTTRVGFVLAITALLAVSSCKKTLTEAPRAIENGNFYNNNAEMDAAINASYEQLRSSNGITGTLGAQLEAYSDYLYAIGSYLILKDYQGLNSTNITRTDGAWNQFYLSIRNANIVIYQTPLATSITEADKARYLAEAKYLRAYNYFWLVRNWGGVPIRTEKELEQPNVKRSTSEEVYTLIINDLKEAETNLPDRQNLIGRATKWAAKSALAEVYFTRNQYAEARDKADEVIKSNQFSLVPVAVSADFLKIFGPTVINTTEEIWYLKMSRPNNQGLYLSTFFSYPASRLHSGGAGFSAFYTDNVRSNFQRTWSASDLRKSFNWLNYDAGVGAPTTSAIFKKLNDSLGIGNFGGGCDMTIYRYADLLLMYAEAASRAGGGPTAAALEALNQVHRRAYGQPATIAWPAGDFKLADYNATTFPTLCIKERGYETQGEAKRWLDLKRLGVATLREYINAEFGKTVADKHLLWPIPASEMSFNTALDPTRDQNPGY